MTRPLDRPEALPGRTYKLRWPESEHAIYVTVNDIVQDDRRRPFEVFINSKVARPAEAVPIWRWEESRSKDRTWPCISRAKN
jgi:hypothetical protein